MKNNNLKKKIIFVSVFVISVLCLTISAYKFYNYSYALTNYMGTSEWYKDYDYSLSGSNVVLTKYNGASLDVVVPSSATINNKNYQTVIDGGVFFENSNITSVTFENGVKAGKSISKLFRYCTSLKKIVLNDFDTSNTTDMSLAFSRINLTSEIDFSKFDTSKVTNMRGMFGVSSFPNLDLTSFKLTSNPNLNIMFTSTKTNYLDISSFDTANCESSEFMFNFADISRIKLGPKTNLRTNSTNAAVFGRGTWLKEEDGKLYSVIEIVQKSLSNNAAGTYKKVSNMSDETHIDYNVTYKIDIPTKIDNFVTDRSDIFSTLSTNIFNGAVLAKIPSSTTSTYNVPGYFELLFKGVVSDKNNNKYDLKLRVDDIKLFNITKRDESNLFQSIVTLSDKGIAFNNFQYKSIDNFKNLKFEDDYNYKEESNYNITLSIVNSSGEVQEGTFLFSAYDLDGISPSDREANNAKYGKYSEGINFISGFDMSTLTLSRNTFLTKMGQNRLTGSRGDNDSEHSEFIIKANATSKFTWTSGADAITKILAYYQPKNVEIQKTDKNGNLLPGAELQLYYGETLIKEWTSTTKSEVLFLNPGQYTLKEKKVPNGYVKSADIIFFVDIEDKLTIDGKNVDKVIMTDIPNKYPYVIHHVEKNNPSNELGIENGTADFDDNVPVNKKSFPGYTYDSKDKDNIKIVTDGEKNVAYVYYVKNDSNYVVRYYDKDTMEEIDDGDYTIQDKAQLDDVLKSSEFIIDIPKYKYDSSDPSSITIVEDVSKNVINLYYVKEKGKVDSKYIDIDTGEEIEKEEIIKGYVDDDYETVKKDIPSYELIKIDGNDKGKIKEEEQHVIYYYRKVKSHSPQTGDNRNITLWIIISIISMISIMVSSIIFVKNKKIN